jgi:hypothetical protein
VTDRIIALLSGTAVILAVWGAVIIGVIGIGLLVARRWFHSALDADSAFTAFWTGWVVLVVGLEFVQLVVPIAAITSVVTSGAALTGLILARADLAAWIGTWSWRRHSGYLIAAMLFALWAAHRAVGAAGLADTAVYHAQAVRWATDYSIVPGLANLHPRLGFNNAGLLFAAQLDVGILRGRASHFVSGVLALPLFLQAVHAAWQLARGAAPEERVSRIFDAALLAPLVVVFLGEEGRSLSTDVQVACVLMAAGSRLVRWIVHGYATTRRARFEVLVAGALLTLAPTIKLSAAAFSLTAWLLLAYLLWRRSFAWKPFAWLAVVSAPIALVWVARNIILTGLIAYPVAGLALEVPWRVPALQVVVENSWIRHYSRWGQGYGLGWSWVGFWIKGLLSPSRISLVAVPIVATAALVGVRWKAWREMLISDARVLLIPVACGLLFWAAVAPEPRFGWGAAWIAFATVAAMTLGTRPHSRATPRLLVVLPLVAAIGIPVAQILVTNPARALGRWSSMFLTFPAGNEIISRLPTPVTRPYRTSRGYLVNSPEDGRCWGGALPCTPWPADDLRLLDPGNPGGGFVQGSEWRPVSDYPRPGSRFVEYVSCRARKEIAKQECIAAVAGDDGGPTQHR